jgi:hypothetical protein
MQILREGIEPGAAVNLCFARNTAPASIFALWTLAGGRSVSGQAADPLTDRQRIDDALELLPDVGRKRGRRRADTPDFAAAVEVVRAVQGDILGRLFSDVEQGDPQLRSIRAF